MKITLYLDEDAQDSDLTQALRLRGVDVVRAWDEGMYQREDDDQLAYASSQGRILYGFNVGDYLRIHTQWVSQGHQHAGIVLAKQQTYSVGEQLKRLLRLVGARSADEMKNQILFLSDLGD